MTKDENHLIENIFDHWTEKQRDSYPTWLELAKYMFEQGRKYEALRSSSE